MVVKSNRKTLQTEGTLQVVGDVAIKYKVDKDAYTKVSEAASAGTKVVVEAAGTNGLIPSPRDVTRDMNWLKCWNDSTIKCVTSEKAESNKVKLYLRRLASMSATNARTTIKHPHRLNL